jgi:D-alanyl-D-alanine dipeptidase
MNTQKDNSFGIVAVFKDKDGIFLFCLVRHADGHWGFPKGHSNKGESEQDTALRELEEETGITNIELVNGKTFFENYSFEKDSVQYEKSVKYFLGMVSSTNTQTPRDFKGEIPELKWLSFEDAKTLLTFPEAKEVLRLVAHYNNPMRITLISDPAVLNISIQENYDPLVDLKTMPEISIDHRKEKESRLCFNVRKSVAEKLIEVNKHLPAGVSLLIVEGYRPLSLQKKYFDGYSKELRTIHPDWDEKRIYAEASKYVAPPDIIPPHSTGGAVDLTLANNGIEVDMGTRLNADPEESDNACFTLATNISDEAKANRKMLIEAMAAVGFVNYPTEWWHWSYGERYWAFITKSPYAHYGNASIMKKITIGQAKYARLLYAALARRGIESITEYPDGHKTIDIAILPARIYIEVDGVQHLNNPDQIITDFKRDYYSEREGFYTLHIHNDDIKNHLNSIADAIAEVVKAKK